MVFNWVDIVCLIILLKSAVEGLSKGFIVSAFKTIGAVVSLYVGIFYRDTVVQFLRGYLPIDVTLTALFKLNNPIESGSEVAAGLGLKSLLDMATSSIGFFIIFIGVQIVFIIMAFFIKGVFHSNRAKPADRFLGLAFGIARITLYISLISAVLTPFVIALPGSFIDKSISGSYVFMHIKLLDFITPLLVKFI